MEKNIYIYIAIMILTTILIRILPLTLIRKKIKNQFLKSFLYYVPYITLAVMTFPAILHCTDSPLAGLLALVIGLVAAFMNLPLIVVALLCCVVAGVVLFL